MGRHTLSKRDERRFALRARRLQRLPVLCEDRLVGKPDATADRMAAALRVSALPWDVAPTKAMEGAVDGEIGDLARWLALSLASAA